MRGTFDNEKIAGLLPEEMRQPGEMLSRRLFFEEE